MLCLLRGPSVLAAKDTSVCSWEISIVLHTLQALCSGRWPFVVEFANVSNWKQTQPYFISPILFEGTVVKPMRGTESLPVHRRGDGQKGAEEKTCMLLFEVECNEYLITRKPNLNFRHLNSFSPRGICLLLVLPRDILQLQPPPFGPRVAVMSSLPRWLPIIGNCKITDHSWLHFIL